MRDDERFCHYCFKRSDNLYLLLDWRQTGLSAYFCYEHYLEVKKYNDAQEQIFKKYFKELNTQVEI